MKILKVLFQWDYQIEEQLNYALKLCKSIKKSIIYDDIKTTLFIMSDV